MGKDEDINRQACWLQDIEPGAELETVPSGLLSLFFFKVCINVDRECRQQDPVAAEVQFQALVYENSSEDGAVIYIDRSVGRHMRSSWAYVVHVGEMTVR